MTLWPFPLLFLSAALPTPDSGAPDASAVAPSQPTIRVFDSRWSHVATPKLGPPRAIGQPGAGCVQGAVALPLRGRGWVVEHPERHREFGHPVLVAYLRDLASRARRERLGLLCVGDLGQPRGGPTPTGHRSHQNGLDVDLWYGPPAKPPSPGQSPVAPVMVDLRTGKLLPVWNSRVASLIETAASDATVDRIFVHPAVKRALCQDKGRAGPWLQRVRPWWGHHDHFHLRLRCPADNPDCKEPQPLPAGQGCDASLDWWFSEDARATAAKRGPPGEGAPPMPEKCEAVLDEEGYPRAKAP
ncbi:MAG TPA: penicillin-insensitive murein endopeptidase [Polyangia bacterium]|nr:penicillin-insensitive murein endopeptidase [Polyangia bacterium]